MNNSAARGDFVFNPYAAKFHMHSAHPDAYCLFLTFSNGFPLNEWQIFNFFNWLYPTRVVTAYVHRPPRVRGMPPQPSLFGRVVFDHVLIPSLVLGNMVKVNFLVDGYPMICSRFVSKRSNNGPRDGGRRRGGSA